MRAIVLADGVDLQLTPDHPWVFYAWEELRVEPIRLPCGCRVEHTEVCEHGYESPMLVAGLVRGSA